MRTDKIALSGLIACLTLSGLALTSSGCAGNRFQRSTGAYLDDKGISTRVKTALFRDPNVSGFDVQVNTFRGEVQLSGFVDSQEQKELAAEIARQIPGVALVSNNLEIKPPSSAMGAPGGTVEGRSDRVIEPVPDRPAADQPRNLAPVRTPGEDLDRTGVLDRTEVDRTLSTADRDLRTDLDRLRSDLDTRMSPQNLRIDAANGKATLSGTVRNDDDKREIERRVREIPGISSVDNNIEVRRP